MALLFEFHGAAYGVWWLINLYIGVGFWYLLCDGGNAWILVGILGSKTYKVRDLGLVNSDPRRLGLLGVYRAQGLWSIDHHSDILTSDHVFSL